jgi:hypothetical protein
MTKDEVFRALLDEWRSDVSKLIDEWSTEIETDEAQADRRFTDWLRRYREGS